MGVNDDYDYNCRYLREVFIHYRMTSKLDVSPLLQSGKIDLDRNCFPRDLEVVECV